jgi:hypothetical protein
MAKLSQADIKAKADEWADLGKKIAKAETAMNDELGPFLILHNEAIKPILEKHEPKIGKLRDKQSEILVEITGWLNAQGKPIVLAGEKAVAAVEMKVGPRAVDPKTFFDLVKTKGSEFWACLKVEIAKAEKFLGKSELDKISEKKSGLVPTLKLK